MKKTFIILIILIILFYTLYRTLTITNSEGDVIFGKDYNTEILDVDYSFIFYINNKKFQLNVNKNKKIEKKALSKNEITIYSKSNKFFSVKLIDSLKSNHSSKFYTKIVSISDIEGNFNVFSQFLINTKVIDKNFNWIFGDGQLVCNGDFFDRGSWNHWCGGRVDASRSN